MPGTDLARVGTYGASSLNEKQQYANMLASAGELVPKNFWSKITPDGQGGMIQPRPLPGAIFYMLETAAMIGVNPMVGLTNIHIIEGKPSLSANLQAALVREAGHRLRVWVQGEGDTLKAICEIVRSDDQDFTFRVEWGIPEMHAAKLGAKDNWVKYRRSMLKARAITECIREACPEVLMGATYSPDELGAVTDEQGEPLDLTVVPDASQGGTPEPDVSRETSQAEKPADKPVEDKPADLPKDGFDWSKAIRSVSSREDAKTLYQKAKSEGILDSTVKVGRKNRVLGEVLTEIGKAMADAEKAAAEAPVEATVDETDPSVGGPASDEAADAAQDANIVDADVVEEPDYN